MLIFETLEEFRCTLARAVHFRGIGLHSGQPITMVLRPAAAGQGAVVHRTDVTHLNNVIPLNYSAVTRTQMGTVVSNSAGVSISTTEHVCAALAAYGIDDVTIEINGAEMPAADGSAAPFARLIARAGIAESSMPRTAWRVMAPITVTDGDKSVQLLPADKRIFDYTVDFAHHLVGQQRRRMLLNSQNFRRSIARARTFGFLAEAQMLKKAGLALGASCDNAVVLDKDRVLNTDGFRYADECVRHKILDAIGDLYLAGAPIIGCYKAHKAGHDLNNKLLRAAFASVQVNKPMVQRVPQPMHVQRAMQLAS